MSLVDPLLRMIGIAALFDLRMISKADANSFSVSSFAMAII